MIDTIVAVIGNRMTLYKLGDDYYGNCPFCDDDKPNMAVSKEKQFFHCYSCGTHGDGVGFVMAHDGLKFPEAVERVAVETT